MQCFREEHSNQDRYQGYLEALAAARIAPRPEWERVELKWASSDRLDPSSSEEERFRGLLQSRQRPTAVFAYDDNLAFRVIQIARELGLRVPQDLSVLGFDSTSLCIWSSPQICSLYNPAREIGRLGVQALIEAIRTHQPCAIQSRLPVSLHRRGSCGPPSQAQSRGKP